MRLRDRRRDEKGGVALGDSPLTLGSSERSNVGFGQNWYVRRSDVSERPRWVPRSHGSKTPFCTSD